MLEKIKDYWIVFSTVVIGVLLFMFQRRGEKLQDALYDKQQAVIKTRLAEVKKKEQQSAKKSKASAMRYRDLKSKYGDLSKRLKRARKAGY